MTASPTPFGDVAASASNVAAPSCVASTTRAARSALLGARPAASPAAACRPCTSNARSAGATARRRRSWRRPATGPQAGRSGSGRIHCCPPLVEVERAQHVVERDEVDAALVGDRPADDVAAGAPAPVDAPVLRHQAVEEVVLRADVEAIVEREDVVRRAAEPPLPHGSPVSTRSATMRPSSVGT